MRAILIVLEFLMWVLATWLFVGLIGSLRWLSPGADPGPDAFLAMTLKLAGLAAFVGALALTARRGGGDRTNPSVEAMQ